MNVKRTLFALAVALTIPSVVEAQNEMCDNSFERCRPPLIAKMDAEMVAIDFFSWFSEDFRYVHALDRAKRRGVRVRFIGNDRWCCDARRTFMNGLKQYQIPSRLALPTPSHIKAVVFEGQQKLFLTGGNFSPGLNPTTPYVNYIDETIITTSHPALVHFMQRIFDDLWVDPTKTRDFAGKLDRIRRHPEYATLIDPRVVYGSGSVTGQNQAAAAAIDRENVGIDIIMYRLNDSYTRAAIKRALARGVPVRILSEPREYPSYPNMRLYVDDLRAAGARFRWRVHQGLTHEKFAVLHGQSLTIIPTNNWDVWSARSATLYLKDEDAYQWSVYHFNRKWNSPTEFK